MEFLTTEGVIFISLAWGTVGGLTLYCIVKVLKGEKNAKK